VEGACMFIRREAYVAIKGLDETYFMYAEDVDLCYALWKIGWQVWYQPSARIIHLGGGSSRYRKIQREIDLYRSRVHFFRKYHGPLPACILELQIYSISLVKIAVHRLLVLLSRGRLGRPIFSFRELRHSMRAS
jgi:N-acetylglucosaminyl-diphospho-decaprenol L-rhamnosyltransferase